MKSFTTIIKRKYFDMKMEDLGRDGYFVEYKSHTPFWDKRLSGLLSGADGVFLVGSEVHRFKLIKKRDLFIGSVPRRYQDASLGNFVVGLWFNKEGFI